MDCLYDAYIDYLKYLRFGIIDFDYEYLHYRILKKLTHGVGNQYTFGGVAPWMIYKLSMTMGIPIFIQYRLYTIADYWNIAFKDYPKRLKHIRKALEFLRINGHEVDELTYQPAIYLLLTDQHAVFSETVPNYGYPIMAIQL